MKGKVTLPYQPHSDTSERAAMAARPKAPTARTRVRKCLQNAGRRGLTDAEIQQALGMGESTERPRRVELVERKLVLDSGRTRLTPSGRSAVVWVAKEFWAEKGEVLPLGLVE
jgi:predicted transcriptional regulator